MGKPAGGAQNFPREGQSFWAVGSCGSEDSEGTWGLEGGDRLVRKGRVACEQEGGALDK